MPKKAWIVTEVLGVSRQLRSVRAECKAQTGVLRGSYMCIYQFKDWEGETRTLKELRDQKQLFRTKKIADAAALSILRSTRTSLRAQLKHTEKNIDAIVNGDL